MRDDRQLRRRCEALVAELRLPPACDLEAVRVAVAGRRDRAVHLMPAELRSPGVCGVWIATHREDWVFYEANTTAYHRRHIVLHEFGHMLCGHAGVPEVGLELAKRVAPAIDPTMIRRVLGRGSYSDREEREAEMFAALAMRPAADAHVVVADGAPAVEADAVLRINAALRGAVGRSGTWSA